MNSTDTAGHRLVALLDTGLPSGIVWKASERAVLGLIEATADRVETLKGLLAAELASPDRSAHRCCEVAAEIRQAEAQTARLVASLDPEMVMEAKSVRHQAAAHARWNGAGVGGRS
jgi:hypothetical protein